MTQSKDVLLGSQSPINHQRVKMFPLRTLLSSILAASFIYADPLVDTSKNSFLWRINTEPPSYMYGTMHVPYTTLWDYIPQNVKAAFNQSSHVFIEIDFSNPQVIADLEQCQLLPDGHHISQVLPREVYLKLRQHLKDTGMDNDDWEHMWPVSILMDKVLVVRQHVIGDDTTVLDDYLFSEAIRTNKKVGGLESGEEHCRPENDISIPLAVYALNHVLDNVPYFLPNSINDEQIMNYQSRNTGCDVYGYDFVRKILPQPHTMMLLDFVRDYNDKVVRGRSKKMGEKIVEILQWKDPQQSYFFAVGAAHFLHCDNFSIPNVVRMGGFTVDQVGPEEEIAFNQYASGAPGVNMMTAILFPFALFAMWFTL